MRDLVSRLLRLAAVVALAVIGLLSAGSATAATTTPIDARLATLGLTGPATASASGSASWSTTGVAKTRVGAFQVVITGSVRPAAGVSAGQRQDAGLEPGQLVVATGVAANTATRMGGSATFGGMDAATKNMIRFSERNPMEGYYDVIGHGSPSSLSGMSADELAAKIASSSGGQNIRLLSCQTGCPSGTFAQDLANRLGVRVMAPTTDIGASGSGKTLTVFDGGQWRWFDPN